MHEHLVRRFADAGLPLVLSDRPIVGVGGGREIIQIDIQHKGDGGRRSEWFRIYRGAEDNRIEVVGLDKKIGQVVVMAQEPPRQFAEAVPYNIISEIGGTKAPGWQQALAKRMGVQPHAIRTNTTRNGKMVLGADIVRTTSGDKRHMLMGLDESHLFIAQLPRGVSAVRDAHALLKSDIVSQAERKSGGSPAPRQGEWFFLEPSTWELRQIEQGIRDNRLIVELGVPIGPFTDSLAIRGRARRVRQFRGNPHLADELVVLPDSGTTAGRRDVFVRGRIRHVEHATKAFSDWRKVIRNTEVGRPVGVNWVD